MPHATINSVELFYEVTGQGLPVVFSHEFAGEARSWQPQVRHLSRLYRCVTYNHRGFPPSGVPDDPRAYSQELLVEDLRGLVQHLGFDQAHFVGFSMGANVVLELALRYPRQCRGIVLVGCGAGSTNRERFESDIHEVVELLATHGIEAFADRYANGPTRVPFRRKDPSGWREFRDHLAQHSPIGQSLTMQGVQLRRPTIFSLRDGLRSLRVPTLIMVGDEDEPALDASLFLKREVGCAGLAIVPQSGHTLNLEEPALFNRTVVDFLQLVEADRWATRAAVTTSLLPTQP